MSSSLEDLLNEDGFRGRKSLIRSRTSLPEDSPTLQPLPFPDRFKKDFMPRNRIRTERIRSDVSQYTTRGELPKFDKDYGRRDNSKMDSWPQKEVIRGKYEKACEIVEVGDEENERVNDKYSEQVYSLDTGKGDELFSSKYSVERDLSLKDRNYKSQGNSFKKSYKVGRRSFSENTRKEIEQPKTIQLVANSENDTILVSEPAIDEVAILAVVSILSGHVKRFLRDKDFREAFRYNCLSSLKLVEAEEEEEEMDNNDNRGESRIVAKLEEAIEAIERAAEESKTSKDLKRAVLQLSVIVGLNSNGLKNGLTSGIPNHKLSACAHLYLSVAYKLQRKDLIAAKHVLQVFCDSPFLARKKLLPELWDYLFSPNLMHLKVWYDQEADSLANTLGKPRKIKLLNTLYNEIMDSGTVQFAAYYKDWLVEGVETVPFPSIHVPSVSIHKTQKESTSSRGQSSEMSGSPAEPFSSQSQPKENCGQYLETSEEKWNSVEENVSSTEKENPQQPPHRKRNLKSLAKSFSTLKPQDSELENGKPSSAELLGFYSKERSTSSSIPQEFICPLTGRLFEEPVTLETGETFERKSIEAWLFYQGKTTCPVTSKPLEFRQVRSTNSVLKRIIQAWKSQYFSTQLSSQRIVNVKEFLSLGGLEFLLQRFETRNLEEGTHVVSLLVHCIEADPNCRNQIAREIDRKCLTDLLHNKQAKARETAVLLLVELICLKRKKDVIRLLGELKSEDREIESTMHVILVFLQNSQPHQKPLVAVLLLHFDLLVEPRKYSVYREEAVDAITEALHSSLRVDEIRESCLRALLILGGQVSCSRRNLTETRMLNEAGFKVTAIENHSDDKNNDSSACDHQDHGDDDDDDDDIDNDDQYKDEWQRNLCMSLLGNGRKSISKAISRCIGSKNSGLITACLTTVEWLSASLASMPDSELQLSAFSALVSRLKECLESAELIEHKVLASASLLNFSQISECRVLLMSMAENITSPLGRLVEVTWTAKKLYTIISGEAL